MDHESTGPQQQPDEMKQLERELRALVPRAPNIELARLMYVAGQASATPVPPAPPPAAGSAWYWPVSTAISSSIAIWLAALLIITDQNPSLMPAPVAKTPHVEVTPTPKPAEDEPLPETSVAVAEKAAGAGDKEMSAAPVTAFEPSAIAVMPDSLSAALTGPGTYGSLTRNILRDAERRNPRPQRVTFWGW